MEALRYLPFLNRETGWVITNQNPFINIPNYPNQEEAHTFIDKEYKNKYGEYYWCGDKYETLEVLFNALNEQKLIIELTVKV
jgi:hypothetical protein